MVSTAANTSVYSFNATQDILSFKSSPSASLLVITAFLGFTSIGGLIGNGLVVSVIKRLRCHGKHSTVHTFLMHLAFSDLLVCCVGIPLTIIMNFVSLKPNSTPHSILCKALRFVQFFAPTISISILTVISIDRYLAIVRPLKKTIARRSKFLITFAWIYSIVLFLPTLYLSKVMNITFRNTTIGYCTPIPNNTTSGLAYLMLIAIFSFVLPLVIISVMYANIVRVVWARHQKIKEGTSSTVSGESVFRRSKKKILKMLLVVVAAFLCCWLPSVIYCGFVEPYTTEFPNPGDAIRIAMYCLGLLNSLINPFIYFFSNTVLRKVCVDLICCRKFSFPAGFQHNTSPALSRRFRTSRNSSLIPDLTSWRYALSRKYDNKTKLVKIGRSTAQSSPHVSRRGRGGLDVSSRRQNSSPLLGLRTNGSPLLRRQGMHAYNDEDNECQNQLRGRKQMPTKTTLEDLEKVTCV